VPFEVVNDGEVTALAGSMSLGKNAVLGWRWARASPLVT